MTDTKNVDSGGALRRLPPEADIQRLLDENAVRKVLVNYCRGIDGVDRDLLASCYHPGALDYHPGLTPEEERDFVSYAIKRGEWRRSNEGGTRHYLTNVHIEVDGDQARSEAYVYAYHWLQPYDDPTQNYCGGARYIDKLERRNGEWKISERKIAQVFREDFPPGSLSFYGKEPHAEGVDQ